MSKLFKLNIVTPGVNMFSGDVELVVVKTVSGDMGIMADHELTVAPLAIGAIKIKNGNDYQVAASSGGFLSVDRGEVNIITDAAEWAAEVDQERAEASRKRAEERIAKAKADSESDIILTRAEASLYRAINRINVKNQYGK